MEDYRPHSGIKKISIKKSSGNGNKKKSLWIIIITAISFILSINILFLSTRLLERVNLFIAFLTVLIIILIGVLFDIIGVAVAAAEETPFHAMASKKYFGARQSIHLIRNADRVASICNDVIGDICGVVSGTAGAYIVVRLSQTIQDTALIGAVISGIIASLTVGGKALGKNMAINNSNMIVYRVGVIVAFFMTRIRRKRG